MKKIMFNDAFGLTQAVLSGRKTMTRRIIPRDFFTLQWDEKGDTLWCEDDMGDFIDVRKTRYAQYKVGEVVAVAESYKSIYNRFLKGCGKEKTDLWRELLKDNYELRDNSKGFVSGWNNKMFVESEFMPTTVKITDCHIEHLQDISDSDCLAEGVVKDTRIFMNFKKDIQDMPAQVPYTTKVNYYPFVRDDVMWYDVFKTAREAFAYLIDKVSGKGTWESNPWVFVYTFELIK